MPQASEVPRITPHHVFYILILLLFFPKSVRLSATAGEAKSPWEARQKPKKYTNVRIQRKYIIHTCTAPIR
nr:MAG TPA: hypothetical protein [Caudoviricetes sp.]